MEHKPWVAGPNEEGDYTIWEGTLDEVGRVVAVTEREDEADSIALSHNAFDALVKALEALNVASSAYINAFHSYDVDMDNPQKAQDHMLAEGSLVKLLRTEVEAALKLAQEK